MRITKKIIAVILALITAMTISVVSASAIEAPTFSLRVISESGNTAVVRIALEKGSFNGVDIWLVAKSSAIKECTEFKTAQGFKDLATDYIINQGLEITAVTNNVTMKSAIISAQKAMTAKLDLFDVTLKKTTTEPLTANDLDLYIDSCSIANDDPSSGNANLDITSFVKVQKYFGTPKTFKLNTTSLALNYKKRATISFESTYSQNELTWTSSNEKVATVDANGNVYASGTGNATITVTSADGKVNESCEITVSYQWWEWIIIIVLFGWIWY